MKELVNDKKIKLGSLTIIILTAILFTFLGLASDTFFTSRNIYTIFYGVSIEYYAVIGFTLLMIMGEVDLSVGSVYGFAGALLGVMMKLWGLPLALALPLTLLCATMFGLITGILVSKYKVNSMMVTIGMLALVKGVSWVLIGALHGKTFPRAYRSLARAKWDGINVTVIAMFVVIILGELYLRRSVIAKKMFYVGENLTTSRIYGIKANKIKIFVFALSSFTAAIGGILASSRITHADVTTGEGLEFKVLTAAVLGGASLFGGKGSLLSAMVGLVFLATILNGMIIFNIEPLLQQFVIGFILILSVFVDTRLNKKG